MTTPHPIQPGDLYWLDQDNGRAVNPAYSHPHVVVAVHPELQTVDVLTLTTNLAAAAEPGNVLLNVGEGHLPKQSVVVVSRASTVSVSRLQTFIGTLGPGRLEEVHAGIQFIHRAFQQR